MSEALLAKLSFVSRGRPKLALGWASVADADRAEVAVSI